MRITQLSPLLANQLAAGEVIERPASVVKELLENALDAGAKRVSIDIEGGGSRLIRVRDDGAGIHPEDFHLAVNSHATSKISDIDDLFAVNTLGFRGEALASISAISHFCLTSKATGIEQARQLRISGNQILGPLTLAAHPQGTTVEVRDLFFNTPVRRKFLRGDKTELTHIDKLVRRLMLSHFDVAFTLTKDGKSILDLSNAGDEASRVRRIAKVFGSAFHSKSYFIDEGVDEVRLWGWLGNTDFQRSQNDLQYTYVNGRMIKDRLINHALRQAYEDSLYPGRHPAFLLYLELPSQSLDVNVHPTKHEVRFDNARQVHDFILSKVKSCLTVKTVSIGASSRSKGDWTPSSPQFDAQQCDIMVGETQRNTASCISPVTQKAFQATRSIIPLSDAYSLVKHAKGMVLCHHRALLQQLSKERFLRALSDGQPASRPLLLPARIRLNKEQLTLLSPYLPALSALGLLIEPIDAAQFVIREIPVITPQLDFKRFIDSMLQQIGHTRLSQVQLVTLICESETTDTQALNEEDTMAIEQYLSSALANEGPRGPFFKCLSEDDWQQVLHG